MRGPMRRHVVGPKPAGGPTPSTIRTRAAHLGRPTERRIELRWRTWLGLLAKAVLVCGVVVTLATLGIEAYRSM